MDLPVTAAANRLGELTSWHAQWRGLRVAVLGLGVTGFAVADTLAELGADVLVVSASGDDERIALLGVIGAGWSRVDDARQPESLEEFGPELIVASPGYRPDHPALHWARERGVPVWGDIELAWRVRDKVTPPAEWLLVTGTNGKTTTVRLAATILAEAGFRAAPCGNIGIPVLDAVRDPGGFDVLVVELSSHQLHGMPVAGPGAVEPHSAVCLNLADDHLEWHGSFAAYAADKARVYANTRVACIYNTADEATEDMVRQAEVVEGARAIGFTLGVPGPSELGVVDGILCDRAFLDERQSSALELATIEELVELGLAAPHLVQNVLAASALARSFGAPPAAILAALRSFRLDPHRIEPVGFARGVSWVDDSKATNPAAAEASLRAFDSVVWIVGGLLKGVDLAPLIRRQSHRLRAAILIGAERAELREAFARHAPRLPLAEVDAEQTDGVMSAAVRLADAYARESDTVLLAPAAASFDQFASYAQRGELFAQAVHGLLGGEADERSATEPSGE